MTALLGKLVALYALWQAWRRPRYSVADLESLLAATVIEVDEADLKWHGRTVVNMRTGEHLHVTDVDGQRLTVEREHCWDAECAADLRAIINRSHPDYAESREHRWEREARELERSR